MIRIAGVISGRSASLLPVMLGALGAGAQTVASTQVSSRTAPDAGLGATSHGDEGALYEGRDVVIVMDGKIYNRQDFGVPGTDATVFAELYRRHGFEGALNQINGDFAVALYDLADRALWLGRDRAGVKPLYYAERPGLFAFASRPRALIALDGIGNAVNWRYAAIFAGSHYRYVDNRPEESPYANVSQLQAGHIICFRGGRSQVTRYWSLPDLPDCTEPEDELAGRYRSLLLDAVEIRIRGARNPGFTLSGGMDSSSVLACTLNRLNGARSAYSVVYSDENFDESSDIRTMVDASGIDWTPISADAPDVFSLVEQMIAANDEPVVTANWLSHFLLCKKVAAAGHDSIVGGLGGDELNAGEFEYFFFYFADLKRQGRTAELDHEIERWSFHHDHPIWHKNAEVANAVMERCTDPNVPGRCLPEMHRLRRYFPALNPDFFVGETFSPIMESPFQSYLKSRTYQDLTRETSPCCLRAEDRHGAAFGLENIVPFFDHRLIEFMFRVPATFKIKDGITKHLLRKSMKGILPEATRARIKKTGFPVPTHQWFTGRYQEALQDLIHSETFRSRGIYNIPVVMKLVEQNQAIVDSGEPRENHMMFLWQLVSMEMWLRQLSAMPRAA